MTNNSNQSADAVNQGGKEAVAMEARPKIPFHSICGENPAGIPARMVGCGQPILTCRELYRCTDCEVPFHKECAKKHFDGQILTDEMIDEIEGKQI